VSGRRVAGGPVNAWRVATCIAAAMAAAQLWLAHRYFGFLTGDEVEVLAEAFRRARGLPYRPWEIRNLFVPDLIVAPVVWLAHVAGVRDPARLIEAAALPSIALSVLTVFFVHALALRWSDGDERAATVASLLFAFHWIPLAFGSTAYPRTLAAACIVLAALLLESRDGQWAAFVAGTLAGLAFADRFSEIVFLIPLLFIAKRRALFVVAGAAVMIAIAVGWYDWMTWGTPFSSAVDFAGLTLARPDFASRVKVQSPVWYLANVARWCSPALLPLLWFARDRRPWLFIAIPLVALSLVAHKELRYLQVLVPFLAIAAAIGFAHLRNRRLAVALVAVALATNLLGMRAFAKKSMPAVLAARDVARDPRVRIIAVSQVWAIGDRLYLGARMQVRDLGTPPVRVASSLAGADAALIYESDLDDAALLADLASQGFTRTDTYRDGPARAVVVFRRRAVRRSGM
jgi:hypothetical protein